MPSHEIAEAAADLETIAQLRRALDVAIGENEQRVVVERQLRAELEALRQLEQLDQALAAMTVTEIDSARARIDTDLVPQLARLLAICLVKEDGTPYNHVTWALGSAEPFGAMELILQRIAGKSPTQIRIAAEAERDQMRAALAPFAVWAQLALDRAGGRDSPLRDADVVFKLDDVAITVGDLRRAVEARSE